MTEARGTAAVIPSAVERSARVIPSEGEGSAPVIPSAAVIPSEVEGSVAAGSPRVPVNSRANRPTSPRSNSPTHQKKGAPQGSSPETARSASRHATCTPRGARGTFPAFKHRVHTFTFVILPSTSVRTTCRFGFHVRRVLLFACETLLPKVTPLSQWKQRLR